jgi:hypothetical protein
LPAVIDFERTKDELLLVKDGRLWRERIVGIVREGRATMVQHGRWIGWELSMRDGWHAIESKRGIGKGREELIIYGYWIR